MLAADLPSLLQGLKYFTRFCVQYFLKPSSITQSTKLQKLQNNRQIFRDATLEEELEAAVNVVQIANIPRQDNVFDLPEALGRVESTAEKTSYDWMTTNHVI